MASTVTRVPFVDLQRHHRPLMAEINAAMARVTERCDFILGEDVRAFEAEFADYCGTREAVGVASGTAALEMLLRAHGVGPGDDVVVPASTFYATAFAVSSVGARPVLADCDETGNLDPSATEAAITPKTRAILVVHLYGRLAKMDDLASIASRAGALLLEDACQAHGAIHHHPGAHHHRTVVRAGAFGEGAAFSFYPGKNLGAFGDGGMVVTDSPEVAQQVRLLRDFGQPAKYQHEILGTNARLDTIQAAILRVKLQRLDQWNAQRRAAADRYADLLAELPLQLPPPAPEGEHVYHLYVVRTDNRDRIRDRLSERGIATGLHYPVPIHLLGAFASLGYQRGDFPQAERLADEGLSLPMFPEITEDEQRYVAEALRAALVA